MSVFRHILKLSIGYVSLGLLGQVGSMIVISQISKTVSEVEFALLVTYNALFDGTLILVGYGTAQSLIKETKNSSFATLETKISAIRPFVFINFLFLLIFSGFLYFVYDYWFLFLLALFNSFVYYNYNIITQAYHWYNFFEKYAFSVLLLTVLYPVTAYVLLLKGLGIYARIYGYLIAVLLSSIFLREKQHYVFLRFSNIKLHLVSYIQKIRELSIYFFSVGLKWLQKNIEVLIIPIVFDFKLLAVYGASRILVRPLTFLVSNIGQAFRSYLFDSLRNGRGTMARTLILVIILGSILIGLLYWILLGYFAHYLIQNEALIDGKILIWVLISGVTASLGVLVKPLLLFKSLVSSVVKLDLIAFLITTIVLVIFKNFFFFLIGKVVIDLIIFILQLSLFLWRK